MFYKFSIKKIYTQNSSIISKLTNNIFYSTKNLIKDTEFSYICPNGEINLVSCMELPIKYGSWSIGESELLYAYQKLNKPMEEIYMEIPIRKINDIIMRYSSREQYVIFNQDSSLPQSDTYLLDKINNERKILEVTDNYLPVKKGVFNNEESELLNKTKKEIKRPPLEILLPFRNRPQIHYWLHLNKDKIDNNDIITGKENEASKKLIFDTSIFGLPIKHKKLSRLEKELLDKASQLVQGIELSQYLPTRSLYDLIKYSLNQKSMIYNDFSTKSKKIIINEEEFLLTQNMLPAKSGHYGSEEKLLFDKLESFGYNSLIISKLAGSRTYSQISQRINRKSKIKALGPWSPEEVERFKEALSKYLPNWDKEENIELHSKIDGLSWELISKIVDTRTSQQCRYYWNAVMNPKIRKFVPFSEEEDKKILELSKKGYNYLQIAKNLGNRSSAQVKTRISSLNALKRKKWTLDEYKRLIDGIELFGLQKWRKVSEYVGTRNLSQCQHKYVPNRYNFYTSNAKNSRVTPEDLNLIFMLDKYLPDQLLLISFLIPGYTINQIKYAYLYHHKSKKPHKVTNEKRWEEAESSLLFDMFLEHGANWELIASKLPDHIEPEHCHNKIAYTIHTSYLSHHLNIMKDALKAKYLEEKKLGRIEPKERKYYNLGKSNNNNSNNSEF